ncbi:RNA-guided endonuclease InsQ/TnpB family protein [Limosilactobacillus fermentum]|uniref:IS200/IS605 family transposase ISMmu1 n=1 Tax=Limosilactobacillus fermentum TaxID=1613 RepID=A0AAJ4GDQ6_LIMFE|nr:RNA-guided endonuclease TnpB family protein [Limosilactobacillus fermentum]AOY85127.1 transposase [Limosilactobacillus fermentum]AUO27018.1 transposase [Limosilactobacillus fermentum]QIX57617.1 IS200/IS605 family transposase ISMmu1 [Limosilactobacillus fermentum]QWQ32919.1 transposase [Limosilactobacillus fermentum]QWS02344.1 transposase [Limosilactobacillus fermentum]
MKSMAQMKCHYGLKVRIYPSDRQKKIIKINSDASRFIYNEMVAINKELMQLRRVKLPIDIVQDRIKQLTMRQNAKQMSNHYQFLEDKRIDSLTKANAIQNYRKAWNAFRKVHATGVPKFHRKSYHWRYQTNCQYPGQKTALLTNGTVCFLDNSHVKVPKIGLLRVAGSQARLLKRICETRIGTVTLTKDSADRFFLSMQLASDTPFVNWPQNTGKQIGIDLNTENFLTTSNGDTVANPRYYRIIKGRLAKAQRILSRRARRAKQEHRPLRTSKNYQKQRLLVAKLHAQVFERRRDFLHNVSTTLIKNHDFVAAEELRSKNMLKNHALAMSIADVGWRTFLGMLAYKAELYHRQFLTVNPKNTTQACHECGFVMGTAGTEKLTLADREWTCPKCHAHHVRDHNAAQNILTKGIIKLA